MTHHPVMLTFDLEEFDLPVEYGQSISSNEQMAITNQGLERLLPLLDKHGISSTFYTTAVYAVNNIETVRLLSAKHEIASHMYSHSVYNEKDIALSKQKLEELLNIKVHGFRMPRMLPFNRELLVDAGYRYDSSLNPTFIPGRYNNFSASRSPYIEAGSDCIVLPVSVATFLRIPLFWLSFKNMSFNLFVYLCKLAIKHDGYLNLYVHPWEFADLGHLAIPWYTRRHSGAALLARLDRLINILKKEGTFVTAENFIASWPGLSSSFKL